MITAKSMKTIVVFAFVVVLLVAISATAFASPYVPHPWNISRLCPHQGCGRTIIMSTLDIQYQSLIGNAHRATPVYTGNCGLGHPTYVYYATDYAYTEDCMKVGNSCWYCGRPM